MSQPLLFPGRHTLFKMLSVCAAQIPLCSFQIMQHCVMVVLYCAQQSSLFAQRGNRVRDTCRYLRSQSSLFVQRDNRVEDTRQYLGLTHGGCCRLVAQKVHETGLPQVAAEHAATARDTVAGTAATARDRAAEHAAAAREVAAAKYSDLSAEVSRISFPLIPGAAREEKD
jgi:hypothetical protein